jgi:hypothetical protein
LARLLLNRLLGGRHAPVEPSLADRPLAVPPRDLDLDVAGARERARADAASTRRVDAHLAERDDRPLWVRRLEEWAPAPVGTSDGQVGFDDGWDPPSAGSQPDSR